MEKAGWHLKPAVVGDLIREVEEDDDDAARNLAERELENRVRGRLLNANLKDVGDRFLSAASTSPQTHRRSLTTPCVLQVLFLNLPYASCIDGARLLDGSPPL